MSIRVVAELVNIDKEGVRPILHDPNFLQNVGTSGDSWFFMRTTQKPNVKRKRGLQTKSMHKALMIAFFVIQGIVHIDRVSEEQTSLQSVLKRDI